MSKKENLSGKNLQELKEFCVSNLLPAYTAKQLTSWMYGKNCFDFNLMSDISLQNRQKLDENARVSFLKPEFSQTSSDETKKYLFKTIDNALFEAVHIPETNRNTLCVSSQTGCPLGCKFCQTGKIGKGRNLEVDEILSQIFFMISEGMSLTNIVFMGMGEPLLNYANVRKSIEILTSPELMGIGKHRITISTVGVLPELKNFLQEFPCELAISLHSPFPDERKSLMPVENKFPISEIISIIRHYTQLTHKTVSFEYIVFKDLNHSQQHVLQLSKLLNGIPAKLNLIRFHNIEDAPFQSPQLSEIIEFQNACKAKGIPTFIRKSRGEDIQAACGLLSANYDLYNSK